MVNWLIIIGIVLIGFLLIKFGSLGKRFWVVLIIIGGLFLYITLSYVAAKNGLDLNTTGGFFKSVGLYGSWLGEGFGNLRSITGYAVNLEWSPNETASKNVAKITPTPKISSTKAKK